MQSFQKACHITTSGRFPDAIDIFRQTIYMAIFAMDLAQQPQELEEVQRIIVACREYILGLSMELARKDLPKEDPEVIARNMELAAYFTRCQLQPIHLTLSLRSAMSLAYKIKNFAMASTFAKRLIQLIEGSEDCANPEVASQARKLLQLCEKTPSDETKLSFDEHRPFIICSNSFSPIYRGRPVCTCPTCGANYKPDYMNIICSICQLGRVGSSATNLSFSED
jgi:coatomer protein complex subunit alpha (xenin)